MKPLEGKTAVVTGGSRGIGAASAEALAAAGARVLITYLQSKEAAAAVVEGIKSIGGRASAYPCDATDPDQIGRFAEHVRQELGGVDVLFNNAGDMLQRQTLEKVTLADIERTLALNVTSTILVTQALLPLLRSGASIINMSSLAARNGGGPGAWLYAASKGAVLTLTRGWATELGPRGVRVNAVAPGVIDTDFHRRHSDSSLLAKIAASVPAGKAGASADVARAVLYLAGEGHGFITGACLDLNGGAYMA